MSNAIDNCIDIRRSDNLIDSRCDSVKGYVCNNLRPLAHAGQAMNIQQFNDDTGFILEGKQVIDI